MSKKEDRVIEEIVMESEILEFTGYKETLNTSSIDALRSTSTFATKLGFSSCDPATDKRLVQLELERLTLLEPTRTPVCLLVRKSVTIEDVTADYKDEQ